MNNILRWTEAKAQGLKQYFTGHPCKNGHLAKRDVSDRACYECKLIKAAKWKHCNPEKHTLANTKWSKANKDSVRNTKRKLIEKDPKRRWASTALQNAKKRAQHRNLPFDLTVEYIYNLPTDTCPVFNTPFKFTGNGRIRPESPSIDRLDPTQGYVVGNVVVISMKANSIKQNATSAELQKVADWLRAKGY
jgi:hypothetical protein